MTAHRPVPKEEQTPPGVESATTEFGPPSYASSLTAIVRGSVPISLSDNSTHAGRSRENHHKDCSALEPANASPHGPAPADGEARAESDTLGHSRPRATPANLYFRCIDSLSPTFLLLTLLTFAVMLLLLYMQLWHSRPHYNNAQ